MARRRGEAAASAPEPQEVLAAYVRIQKAADADVLRALREAYKDVNAQLGKMARTGAGEFQRSRLLAIKKRILEAQAEVFERTGKIVERRRVEAAARAIQVAGRYDEAAFAAAGREADARALSAGLEETEARAIDAVEARISGSSHIPLSERVYRTQAWSSGVLERRINSALARGLNAQEFAREIAPLVNPNTPGGPRYAALRLARTEINNAYHVMAIRAAQLKPWISKMEWHLSKSHPKRPGGPEACELLAGRTFAVDEVPIKPHPQCLCYITPVVDGDDDDFLDSLADGEFDDFLEEFAARQGIDLSGSPAFSAANKATPAQAAPALPPTKKAAPVKKAAKKATPAPAPVKAPAKKAPAKKAGLVESIASEPVSGPAPSEARFQVPRLNNVPEGEHAARLTSDPVMRREFDLQEAIAPNCASQLSGFELVPSLGAGTGGLHNRQLRVIQIASELSDGLSGRDIATRAERAGYHPKCGAEHSSAQVHLAHEFGHHVHHMLDFMDIDDREALRDLIADEIGVPRPARADRNDPLFNSQHLAPLDVWLLQNSNRVSNAFGRYALTNEREMMAEIWAAYSTNPDTKNAAIKAIGERMRELGEAGAQRGRVERPDEDAARVASVAETIQKKMRELGYNI